MSIKDDAATLLIRLAQLQQTNTTFRTEYISGPDLDKLLQIGPTRLSDAVAFLEESGYLEALKTFGTAPYEFNSVMLTSRGRFEAERQMEGEHLGIADVVEAKMSDPAPATVTRLAQPVGSPFGFNSPDWERVSLDHEDAGRLVVVLGHQSDSRYFDSVRLRASIKTEFENALAAALPRVRRPISLDFRVLGAGYGSHLFNQIACDIISSDIAVFETSDSNSNVMIEMGVALTWGTRVLPIRRHDASPPPSDISGQTWAKYDADGSIWIDPRHGAELAKMVELACLRKPRRS